MPFIPAVHQCKAGWPTDLGSSRKPPTKSPFCLISGIGTKTGDVLVLKWNQKNAWTNGVILVGETGSKCKNALSLFSVLWHPLKVTRNQYQSRITCCFRCSSTSSDFSNISLQWDHLKWQSFRESQHKNNRVLWPSLVKHFPILVFGTFEWSLVQLFCKAALSHSAQNVFNAAIGQSNIKYLNSPWSQQETFWIPLPSRPIRIANERSNDSQKRKAAGANHKCWLKKKTLEYVYVRMK